MTFAFVFRLCLCVLSYAKSIGHKCTCNVWKKEIIPEFMCRAICHITKSGRREKILLHGHLTP